MELKKYSALGGRVEGGRAPQWVGVESPQARKSKKGDEDHGKKKVKKRSSGKSGHWITYRITQSPGLNLLPVNSGIYKVRIDVKAEKPKQKPGKQQRLVKTIPITLREVHNLC